MEKSKNLERPKSKNLLFKVEIGLLIICLIVDLCVWFTATATDEGFGQRIFVMFYLFPLTALALVMFFCGLLILRKESLIYRILFYIIISTVVVKSILVFFFIMLISNRF